MSNSPHLFAPQTHALWRTLHQWIAALIARFGEPSAIMALVFMSPLLRRAADLALRPIEKLMRLLLLIEAAHAEPLIEAKSRTLTEARALKDSGHVQDPDDASSWRAPFKLATHTGAPTHSSSEIGAGAPRLLPSAPIAERLEALLRVLDDPARFIRKLQQKLTHRRTPILQKLTRPPRGDESVSLSAARFLAGRRFYDFCNSS